MIYLRARWYDPSTGTLLGRDPFAGFPTMPYSLHPYQYGYSAPTMYTDPSGLCVTGAVVDTVVCVAGGAVSVTAAAAAAAASLVAIPALALGAFYYYNPDERKDLLRGVDYVTSGGEGYVWVTPPHDDGPPPLRVTAPHVPDRTDVSAYIFLDSSSDECSLWPFPLDSGLPPWREELSLTEGQELVPWVYQSSTDLSNNLGGFTGDKKQAHHLIPEEHKTHRFVRRAARAGWYHDAAYNGILLPDNDADSRSLGLPKHNTQHKKYSQDVLDALDRLERKAQRNSWTDQQAFDELQKLARRMERRVRKMGGGIRACL